MTGRLLFKPDLGDPRADDSKIIPAASAVEANLESSLRADGSGKHQVQLDLDVPHIYVTSSTDGHGHLRFPTLHLTTDEYQDLLGTLVRYGIVQRRWARMLGRTGQTYLRVPGEDKDYLGEGCYGQRVNRKTVKAV
jgi:hypothetical protein